MDSPLLWENLAVSEESSKATSKDLLCRQVSMLERWWKELWSLRNSQMPVHLVFSNLYYFFNDKTRRYQIRI